MSFSNSGMNNVANISVQEGDIILEEDPFSFQYLPVEDKITYTPYKEHIKKMSQTENKKYCETKASPLKQFSSIEDNMPILKKKIVLNALQKCQVLTAVNPSEFYIQRQVDYANLERMVEIIDLYPKMNTRNSNFKPEIGKIYIGKFKEDNYWYRAKILDKLDDEQFHVYYIDYCNSETIHISRLMECPEELVNVPEFAIKCALLDVEPVGEEGWSTEAIKVFNMMIAKEESEVMFYKTVEIDSSSVCHVDLRSIFFAKNVSDEESFSIRKALAFMGYALFRGCSYDHELQEACREINKYDKDYNLPEIGINTTMTVKPGIIHTPWSFYLYVVSEMGKHDVEYNSLQEHCNATEISTKVNWMIFYPMKGMVCTTYDNGKWNRAVIRKVYGNGKVQVLNVDTGLECHMSYTDLRKIPDSFVRFPVQAIKCSLFNTFPLEGSQAQEEDWTGESIEFFTDWLNNSAELKATVSKNKQEPFEVELTNSFNGRNINIAELLVEKNYAITTVENFMPSLAGEFLDMDPHEDKKFASIKKTTTSVSDVNELYIKSPVKKPQQKNLKFDANCGKKVEINYLSLQSPDCIFIRFESQRIVCREMQKCLWHQWNTFQIIRPYGFCVNGVYGLEYETNSYARAKILEVKEDDTCTVHLMDIGGFKTCKPSELHILPNDIRMTKGLSVIVKLANIIPTCGLESWPNTTIDTLKEDLTMREELFMIKCASAYKDPMLYNLKVLPVQLGWVEVNCPGPFEPDTISYPLFNQLLTNLGLALPKRLTSVTATEYQESLSSEVDSNNGHVLIDAKSDAGLFLPPKKPVKTWPPQEPLSVGIYDAIISNIGDDGSIFFRLADNNLLLEQMELTYKFKYGTTNQSNKDLAWGVTWPVVAQYFADDTWCRAIVKSVDKESINIHFVDYGNDVPVCISKIRASEDLYMKTPIVCYNGCLPDIAPCGVTWTQDSLDLIHRLVVDEKIRISVLEPYEPEHPDKLVPIRAYLVKTNQNLSDFLVTIGDICRYKEDVICIGTQSGFEETTPEQRTESLKDDTETPISSPEPYSSPQMSEIEDDYVYERKNIPLSNSFDFHDGELLEEIFTETPVLQFELPSLQLPFTDAFPVHLVKIINARNAFIIPFVDGHTKIPFTEELRVIQSKFCSSMEHVEETIKTCEVATTLDYYKKIYMCEDDCRWKRICLLEDLEELVKVRFFDYGTEGLVKKSEIRILPNSAYNIPPMSLPICVIDEESQALRSLLFKYSLEQIKDKVNGLKTTVFASVVELRRTSRIRLFIVIEGEKLDLFDYLTK